MKKKVKKNLLTIAISFLSIGALASIGSFINDANDWYNDLLSSNVTSDISSSEEKSPSVEDITTYYLVGSFNGVDNWMSREYPLEVVSCDDPSVKTQYYLEKEFSVEDEFKITDGKEIWIGHDVIENSYMYAVNDKNGNIIITCSGTLSLYLKEYYDGHYSIWIHNFDYDYDDSGDSSSSSSSSEEAVPESLINLSVRKSNYGTAIEVEDTYEMLHIISADGSDYLKTTTDSYAFFVGRQRSFSIYCIDESSLNLNQEIEYYISNITYEGTNINLSNPLIIGPSENIEVLDDGIKLKKNNNSIGTHLFFNILYGRIITGEYAQDEDTLTIICIAYENDFPVLTATAYSTEDDSEIGTYNYRLVKSSYEYILDEQYDRLYTFNDNSRIVWGVYYETIQLKNINVIYNGISQGLEILDTENSTMDYIDISNNTIDFLQKEYVERLTIYDIETNVLTFFFGDILAGQ